MTQIQEQNDNQKSISSESAMDVESQSIIDQQPTTDQTINNECNNIILANSELTLVKKNGTSQNR